MAKMTHRININVADIRNRPKFKSERTTQALYNEPVEVLKDGDDYCHIKLHDGYKGYIKKLFLSKIDDNSELNYMVRATLTPAYSSPDKNSRVMTVLPFAAELTARPENDIFVSVNSPRYGLVFVKCSDLILSSEKPQLTRKNVPQLLEIANRFMGAPYLWGGRSYFGVDCSGFVNVLLKYFGLPYPRKTKDQIHFGQKVPFGEAEPGDLLFFRIHVGIALSKTEYIHSSLSQGGVHINALDPDSKWYLRYRDLTLKGIRRFTIE
jgi:gamma-D-glutamyl-L-lysine dipeptidyl-peptidase